MSETLIQLVDENDVPLRGGTMDEAQLEGFWHRVTGVMVKDSRRGKYLLQKIAPNPYYNGGKWNVTSTGHVDDGESYVDAAAREAEEEMGIVGLNLVEFDAYRAEKEAYRTGRNRMYKRHYKIFLAEANSDNLVVSPDESEVEEVVWMSGDELTRIRAKSPQLFSDTLNRFIDREFPNGN
ncbi:MAG: NUDIX domain-containing protein [Candidatus Saccharibacteria bacterium]|jgi:isopentenyldiphosphate isomerase|nr:NUDIX domain-containing protein [Patescibacteria group bacterium]MCA9335683.1 NUDIX domain-containing protein [Candidatus Saccharibacteria bacterium]MCA9336599.1 NUDIX domain-containing protein [Candidatus Saccharibacteria bacterium]MCA9339872.1 NUDIX domain-containing protein [Candidatus Saccharibacteria bacterium]HPQ82229.1 NUDIX domain-containing protein [Candidatus Saccharimonas sp.]